jgi:hypothetical protein
MFNIIHEVQKQMRNLYPMIRMIILLFHVLYCAINVAVSIYIIISLILLILIIICFIITYYDTILYVPKTRICQYLTILIIGICIKKYILITEIVLYFENCSETILLLLIKLIIIITELLTKCTTTIKEYSVLDLIICTVLIKLTYSWLKPMIMRIPRNELNNLYENIYVICFELLTILINFCILIIVSLCFCIIYARYNRVHLNDTEIANINSSLIEHLRNL